MKDSHIGTYGTLSLIMYTALLFFAICSLPPQYAPFFILAADPYAKMLTSQVVYILPYARDEQTAKSKVVYRNYNLWAGLSLTVQGLLPLALIIFFLRSATKALCDYSPLTSHLSLLITPALLIYFLIIYIKKHIGGYTGDCCGALFLMAELMFYLTASVYAL